MCRVAAVLIPDAYLYSIGGLLDAFHIANDHIRRQQGEQMELFECQTVAVSDAPVPTNTGLNVQADLTLNAAGKFELIYIPAFFYQGMSTFDDATVSLKSLFDWLAMHWREGATLAANCTGTLFLAQSGLLDGRRATTTWWLERAFRRRYPRVDLDANALLTEDQRLLTTGAMTANLNMAIELIGRYAGPQLATVCAQTMLIDSGPNLQRPYQELLATELSSDPVVAKTQYWLQNHLGEEIGIKGLADDMNVSQRTLIRRFNAEIGIPPLVYLQNVRIETAKQMLKTSGAPLAEIIERVGYLDGSSFSKLFKKRTGLTPHAYRQRFNRQSHQKSDRASAAQRESRLKTNYP